MKKINKKRINVLCDEQNSIVEKALPLSFKDPARKALEQLFKTNLDNILKELK